jgi:pyridoxine 5-phosphate synthase
VHRARPTQCTLVPDDPAAKTSDHGWDLARDGGRLAPIVAELRAARVRVSLFMDASGDLDAAAALGADRIELYTEPYAAAHGGHGSGALLARLADAAAHARSLGLGVNAGHDLSLANVGELCAIPAGIDEVSIGHALIADALELGLDNAVRAYLVRISTRTRH